jgi:hypothetical protein
VQSICLCYVVEYTKWVAVADGSCWNTAVKIAFGLNVILVIKFFVAL